MAENEEGGFFENLLTGAGAISGAMFGYDDGNGGGAGLIIGALILGGIGKAVGRFADGVFQLIYFIIILFLNAAIRRTIIDAITS